MPPDCKGYKIVEVLLKVLLKVLFFISFSLFFILLKLLLLAIIVIEKSVKFNQTKLWIECDSIYVVHALNN